MKTKLFLLVFFVLVLLQPADCSAKAMIPIVKTNSCCGLVTTDFVPGFQAKLDHPPFQPIVRTWDQWLFEKSLYYDGMLGPYFLRIIIAVLLVCIVWYMRQNKKLIRKIAKYEPRQV